MIEFNYKADCELPAKVPKNFETHLDYEGLFTIKVDNQIYFEEEYFCIIEFLSFIQDWIESHDNRIIKDMEYNSIETDENPLILFSRCEDGWKISSPWEKFKCERVFSYDEIFQSIIQLEKDIGLSRVTFDFVHEGALPRHIPRIKGRRLAYKGYFSIKVEERVLFEEKRFCIFEFLTEVRRWIGDYDDDTVADMTYHSVETDENPLILFSQCEDGWKILSPWEKYKCEEIFSYDEILRAVNALEHEIGLKEKRKLIRFHFR